MINNIFDTHAHYDDVQFDEDRNELLSSLLYKGVCNIINCGTNLKTSRFTTKLCDKYNYIYGAVGIHPEEANANSFAEIEEIRKLTRNKKIVAIGEIGLDYHWKEVPKELQTAVFAKQIKLANELDMPIIVHDREAHADTLKILKEYMPKGVLHCFSGSVETAREIIALGMYIGIGGAVTFKNARKPTETAAYIPLERLLLETDCPYMAPTPFRGKRNNSSLIIYTAQKIAEIRSTDVSVIINAAEANAKKLFGI